MVGALLERGDDLLVARSPDRPDSAPSARRSSPRPRPSASRGTPARSPAARRGSGSRCSSRDRLPRRRRPSCRSDRSRRATSCSVPIGISVATTWGPNAALSESSVRKKSARSRSSMLTNTSRARSSSAARLQRRLAWTSTPITALMTKIADSQTCRRPERIGDEARIPGRVDQVDTAIRATRTTSSVAEIDIWRAFSSGSESETVVPSITDPSRLVAPACEQQRLVQRGLTTAPVADEGHVADPIRGLVHACLLSYRCLTGDLIASRADLSTRSNRSPGISGLERRATARGVGAELGAQPQDGLRVQLRDARLGDAEHLADLPQRQVLVVVERDHELLALGQRRDRVGDPVAHLALHRRASAGRGAAVGQRVQQRHLVAAGVRDVPQLVERDDRGIGDLQQGVVEVLDADLQLAGDLLVGRCALESAPRASCSHARSPWRARALSAGPSRACATRRGSRRGCG